MLVTIIATHIQKKMPIIIKNTNKKCCINCNGFGKECDNGGAWIYCEIRDYYENDFDGDCGELKGCNFFNNSKSEYDMQSVIVKVYEDYFKPNGLAYEDCEFVCKLVINSSGYVCSHNDAFKNISETMMGYLNENYNPHTSIIISHKKTEIVESIKSRINKKNRSGGGNEWIKVSDRLPRKGGTYVIYDNEIGEGLYNESREWKSTDRPIKNAMGVQVLRQTIHPSFWMDIKPPNDLIKERNEWIHFKTQLPTKKDLPFITEDFDKFYEVWEDSDYFDELTDNDRDLFVKWKPINQPIK